MRWYTLQMYLVELFYVMKLISHQYLFHEGVFMIHFIKFKRFLSFSMFPKRLLWGLFSEMVFMCINRNTHIISRADDVLLTHCHVSKWVIQWLRLLSIRIIYLTSLSLAASVIVLNSPKDKCMVVLTMKVYSSNVPYSGWTSLTIVGNWGFLSRSWFHRSDWGILMTSSNGS